MKYQLIGMMTELELLPMVNSESSQFVLNDYIIMLQRFRRLMETNEMLMTAVQKTSIIEGQDWLAYDPVILCGI